MKRKEFSKSIIAFAIILFCSSSYGACSSNDEEIDSASKVTETPQDSENSKTIEEIRYLSLTRQQREQVKASNDFAFRLAQATMKNDKSQVISPLSVAYLTGMLANGVGENTLNEIATTLGMNGKSLKEINSYFKMMLNDLPRLDLSTTLSQSNALFVNQGYTIFDEYKKTISEYYCADFETLDFNQQSAIVRINNWANEHTKGMIKSIVDNIDPKTAAYGLNAVYFKGGWINKFKAEETREETFGTNGEMLPMMHLNANLSYAEMDMCKLIQMPYGNGAFLMTVLLPNEGMTPTKLMEIIDAETFNKLSSSVYTYNIDVKMPRFETECRADLTDVLTNLGMPSLFSKQERFEKMTKDNFNINEIVQTAGIKVDENGSEAAAITHVMFTSNGNEPEIKPASFHANRPFIYIISERDHGIILFLGHYEGD